MANSYYLYYILLILLMLFISIFNNKFALGMVRVGLATDGRTEVSSQLIMLALLVYLKVVTGLINYSPVYTSPFKPV